ncbi:MAG: DUF255 domain-containing protein [Bacteroidota bacterium]
MKKVVLGFGLLLVLAMSYAYANPTTDPTPEAKAEAINWLTWEEAMEAMEKEPKKIFVDVYTDWCGWCKRMDASTFTDEDVISYMNENFYAVKFDAEGRDTKEYKGRTLEFRPSPGGRRAGVHELAVVLLNGRLGYPSFVYLDEAQESLKISPGYKTPDVLLQEMKVIAAGR